VFLQDPNLSDVDISPKEFLKRVEQTVKHKQPGNAASGASSKSSMHSNNNPEGAKLFDGTVTDGRQHPPTSIYAQQQFLPYTNNHPNSDYVPQQLNMRHHQPNGTLTSPPRRMDSHESFASSNSYQQQQQQQQQQDTTLQHRYVSQHNHHQQQYHHHHQQSPLSTTPAITNPTNATTTIPTPSL
jgi:hypothetical protein